MTKYVKKPITIEAKQYKDKSILDWIECKAFIDIHDRLCIETLEGVMACNKGDYIVKGIQGEYYPVREDIFHETYEKVGTITREQALEQLLQWAEQCDFGFDNFRDDNLVDWEEFCDENDDLNYTEAMIQYARKFLESLPR